MATVKGFIFDYSKCVGCHACMVACYAENSTKPPLSWRQINHYNKQKLPLLGFVHLSIACNHCKEAPCVKACPSGAYTVDVDTRAVIHNPEKCLGCKYCTWACPFDAPKYNPEIGIIEKCNFCNHRLKEGQIPACALNCPTGALSFGDIEEKQIPEAFGLSQKAIYPRISIVGSEVKDLVPQMDNSAVAEDASRVRQMEVSKSYVNPLAEWPLVLFTFIGALLTGWQISSIFESSISLSPWLFTLLGGIAMIISTIHLGKPLRAHLSILNLKTSWLSREILLFGLFMITGFIALVFDIWWLVIASATIGFSFLASVEMLYMVTNKKTGFYLHSGNTIAIALVFASLFSMQWDFLIVVIALKAAIYVVNIGSNPKGLSSRIALISFARFILGFVVPFGLIAFSEIGFGSILVVFIILGELIDRFMFYYDFEPERPFSITTR